MTQSSQAARADVAVIGAGFGGLGAALTLAEAGARVVVLEALRYPGGCASTFSRAGYRFESGATLFSGFAPGQPFHRWIERHRMPVELDAIDPIVELRAGDLTLPIPAERDRLIERLATGPEAPQVRAFFERQRAVADALWAILDDPSLLPPFDLPMLLRHAARSPRYLPVLSCVGRPLGALLDRLGVGGHAPLRRFLDATLQITVQTSAAEAEAPLALSALDYYFRGTRHVRGGIGALADAMVGAIRACGGEVRFSDRALSIEPDSSGWILRSRKGSVAARAVVANVLPQSLPGLLGRPARRSAPLARRVDDGWGAVMLYLGLDPAAPLRPEAHHLELVHRPELPYTEGNHVFLSISALDEARGPGGRRTVTCSTHLPASALRDAEPARQARVVAAVQQAMRDTIARRAPEVWGARVFEMTASPRTFERFTLRPGGLVGGIPRRAGLENYAQLGPFEAEERLWLAGDSVFPGQSTLATAVGGMRIASAIQRALSA